MIPQFPEFKTIGIEDMPVLEKHIKESSRSICELNAPNLVIWSDFDRPEATMINNNLCIRINPLDETPYFLEPLSTHCIEKTISTCLASAKKISRVSEQFIPLISSNGYQIRCIRNHFDYIYKVKDLAQMKGKKYDGKRNHIKRFVRLYPNYLFKPFSAILNDKALALFEKWFNAKKESRFFPRLAHQAQKTALENALKYYKELNLIGGALLSNDNLMCFIIGSKLNKDTASVHFEYCDPEIHGVFAAALNCPCNTIFKGFEYINLEQDLGIPGLRKSKISYHPVKIEKKYEITAGHK